MTDGRFELWYGIIIMGLGIPVFIHYAMKYIHDCISKARREDRALYEVIFPDKEVE